jgi:hypothetical protein
LREVTRETKTTINGQPALPQEDLLCDIMILDIFCGLDLSCITLRL